MSKSVRLDGDFLQGRGGMGAKPLLSTASPHPQGQRNRAELLP